MGLDVDGGPSNMDCRASLAMTDWGADGRPLVIARYEAIHEDGCAWLAMTDWVADGRLLVIARYEAIHVDCHASLAMTDWGADGCAWFAMTEWVADGCAWLAMTGWVADGRPLVIARYEAIHGLLRSCTLGCDAHHEF